MHHHHHLLHLFLASLALTACLSVASASEDSHDHGDEEGESSLSPEYIAVYSLGVPGSYELQLGAEGGEAFEEETLEFMLVPTSSADSEGLEEAEEATEAGERVNQTNKCTYIIRTKYTTTTTRKCTRMRSLPVG